MSNFLLVERTFEFAVRITKLCTYLDTQFGTPRLLSCQLFRSGTSVAANLEESRAGQSIKDFIHKQEIALKEARETRYWLKLLIKSELIEQQKVKPLLDESDELIKILAKSIITNKKKLPNKEDKIKST
ncbi:MAG: four helix bundle protein [Nostocales cyanobacterium 94392]|nr:four helix bundle protein [Nostocales cyanobacterium 94392]